MKSLIPFFLLLVLCGMAEVLSSQRTLINKNMTWEEALRYCRQNYITLGYPITPNQPSTFDTDAAQTQTVSVWTGLRFLDGKWFWVDVDHLEIPFSMPSCPIQNYRCGARNNKTQVWENVDCDEKLNFLCSVSV